jgi:hypothetical protein
MTAEKLEGGIDALSDFLLRYIADGFGGIFDRFEVGKKFAMLIAKGLSECWHFVALLLRSRYACSNGTSTKRARFR